MVEVGRVELPSSEFRALNTTSLAFFESRQTREKKQTALTQSLPVSIMFDKTVAHDPSSYYTSNPVEESRTDVPGAIRREQKQERETRSLPLRIRFWHVSRSWPFYEWTRLLGLRQSTLNPYRCPSPPMPL